MSTISSNLPSVPVTRQPAAAPQGTEPKSVSPQDVAVTLRQTADADMERANQLKAEAERLRGEGGAKLNSGAVNVAEGGLKVGQGAANLAQGTLVQAEGQAQVQSGLDQEKAGAEKEAGGIAGFATKLGEAQQLNEASMIITANTTGELVNELGFLKDARSNQKTFAEQLAAGQSFTSASQAELGNIATARDAEAAGSATVASGKEQFDAGIAQTQQGSATLLTGVGQVAAGNSKAVLADEARGENLLYTESGNTNNALGAAKTEQSQSKQTDSLNSFRDAYKNYDKSACKKAQGDEALSVADLLAQVAQIDQQAGEALVAIPGFVAEGKKTIGDSTLKSEDSAINRQRGEGFLSESTTLFARAQESTKLGLHLIAESDQLAGQAQTYNEKGAADLAQAAAKDAQATQLQGEADQLSADGQANVLQGISDRVAGFAAAGQGSVTMLKGVHAESAAQEVQGDSSANIGLLGEALAGNQSDRQATLDAANTLWANTATAQGAQGEWNGLQADFNSAKVQNAVGRLGDLGTIAAGESDQVSGMNAQKEGLDKVQAGTDQQVQGNEQVAAGSAQVAQGKAEITQGKAQVKKGDENAAAGGVLENKANQYNAVADSVAPRK